MGEVDVTFVVVFPRDKFKTGWKRLAGS